MASSTSPPGEASQNGVASTPNRASAFEAEPEVLEWDESPFDRSQVRASRFAIESRAESTRVIAGGDAVRRGETDHLKAGAVKSFVDAVGGEENTRVNGALLERAEHGTKLFANNLETTVNGRMSISAVGKLGEDGIVMGGALTDTWTGGLLIAAAMSDDLVVGAGARITAPVDVWLNKLAGIEERPGTANADGIMLDVCGTLFEREYGTGLHAAGGVAFSGTVYQTQRVGFRPLMRAAIGVRNLIPGAGAAAGEPPPPAPPPLPLGAAQGVMVAAAVAGAAARGVGSVDNFQDVGRVIGAADEMQNAATLHRAADTASVVEDLSTGARNLNVPSPNPGRLDLADPSNGMASPNQVAGAQMPNGMGNPLPVVEDARGQHVGGLPSGWQSPMTPGQLQQASFLPETFDLENALARIDHAVYGPPGGTVHGGGETLSGLIETRQLMLDDIHAAIAGKLEELTGGGKQLSEFEDLPTGINKTVPGGTGLNPNVPWPRALAEGEEARQAQLMAEVDALKALEDAVEGGEDPSTAVPRLLEEARQLYGAEDVRTKAFADMVDWFDEYAAATQVDVKLAELDLYMLARAEFLSGRDPRVALQAVLEGGESSAAMQAAVSRLLNNFNSRIYKLGASVPDGMDTTALQTAWRGLAEQYRNAASAIDTSTAEGAERAKALNDLASNLGMAALDMRRGRDPRTKLLEHIRVLEARVFLDGMDGSGEASVLRAAVAEYADLVADFRGAGNAIGGLGQGFSPTAAGIGEDVRTALTDGTDLDPSPPYPGLPDEYGVEVRLTIEPPSYSSQYLDSIRYPGLLDEIRQILDLDIEALEDAATSGARLDGIDGVSSAVLDPVQPQLDDVGAGWVAQGSPPGSPSGSQVDLSGDYQVMQGTESADSATSVATVSEDTQAVVSNMPLQAVPDDFDWSDTMTTMRDRYTGHRRASNWRAALAYADAVDDIRSDLLEAFIRFGGDADALASENHDDIYRAMQALLDQATQAGDMAEAGRLTDYLESLNQQTYNAFADLLERGDEFESAARGTIQPLDAHIDQSRLMDWLRAQEQGAMQRMAGSTDPDAIQAASHELSYFQQVITAMEDGRNPLTESGDQIAFLRRTNPDQATIYEDFHGRLLQTLSDPAFHKSAAEMGDTTYAPVVQLRPELGSPTSASAGNGISTQAFNPQIGDPEARVAEFSSGDYATNRDVINANIGDDDFARVPEQPPAGINQADFAQPAQAQGPQGILKNGDPGPIDMSDGRAVNRGPDGEDITDESVKAWNRAMIADANTEAILRQGGIGNYMDVMAEQRTPYQRMADDVALNPYAAARTDAANQMWDTMRVRDTRPPSEWSRFPNRQGMRSWDNAARSRKSVRFGDASVVMVGADAEDVLAIKTQWSELDAGDSAMPWWTGSGINRGTDPINADEAVRHVPTPRPANSVPGYPSKWRAGRQPGFDRLADAPGAFPFSTREQMVLDLMQGQRIDVRHIDFLEGALDDAVRTGWVRNKEWRKMAELLRSLRHGAAAGESIASFARGLDWRTLAKMLDVLDSSASLT